MMSPSAHQGEGRVLVAVPRRERVRAPRTLASRRGLLNSSWRMGFILTLS